MIPEDAVYNWVNGGTNQSLRTRYGKANVLAQWAKYLFSLGYTPLWIPTVRYTNNTGFVPHIFSTAEMQKIWSTVDHLLPSKIYPNMHRCIPTLFRLLYGCGLRISEALQITLRDIDFSTNVINPSPYQIGQRTACSHVGFRCKSNESVRRWAWE